MKIQTLGRKSQNVYKHVFNADTIVIKKGAPVVLSLGTRGGYGVKSVSNLAAAEQGLFFGCATADIPVSAEGDVIFGYFEYARVVVQSRSDTDAVWASSTGFALGDVLAILTASSTVAGQSVGAQCFSRSAAGSAFTNRQEVIMAETGASTTTAASSLSAAAVGGGIYSTAFKKVFITIT